MATLRLILALRTGFAISASWSVNVSVVLHSANIVPFVDFPGFSGHVGVFVQLFRIPQDLRRLNDYGGALDCRMNQCS
jgi:hypothetical protein